jgi:hypothetical protein
VELAVDELDLVPLNNLESNQQTPIKIKNSKATPFLAKNKPLIRV